jgi:hypothetical protein
MCFPEEEEAFHSLENSNEYVLIDTVCALPLQLVLWIILFVCQQKTTMQPLVQIFAG